MFKLFNFWKSEPVVDNSTTPEEASEVTVKHVETQTSKHVETQTSLEQYKDLKRRCAEVDIYYSSPVIINNTPIEIRTLDDVKKYISTNVRVKVRDLTYYSGNGARYVSNEMKHPALSISQTDYSSEQHEYHKFMFDRCSTFLSQTFEGKTLDEFIEEFKGYSLLNAKWKFLNYITISDVKTMRFRISEKDDGTCTVDNIYTTQLFDPKKLVINMIRISPTCFDYVEFLPEPDT
jgi:hypothetical protein